MRSIVSIGRCAVADAGAVTFGNGTTGITGGAAVPLLGPFARRLARERARRARRRTSVAAMSCAGVLHGHSSRVLAALHELDVHTPNRSELPIIEVPLRDHTRIDAVGRLLFERGIYVTLAVYPLVPKAEVGFRIQLDGGQHRRRGRQSDRRPQRARAARRAVLGRRTRRGAPRPDAGGPPHDGARGETKPLAGRTCRCGRPIWPSVRCSRRSTCWCRRSRATRS